MKIPLFLFILLKFGMASVFCQEIPTNVKSKIKEYAWGVYENTRQTHLCTSDELYLEEVYDSLLNDIAIYRVSLAPLDISGSYKIYLPVLRQTGNIIKISDIPEFNNILKEKLKFPISNLDRVILYLILSGYYGNSFAHAVVIPSSYSMKNFSYFLPHPASSGIFVRADSVYFPKHNISFKSLKVNLTLISSLGLDSRFLVSCQFNTDQFIKEMAFAIIK